MKIMRKYSREGSGFVDPRLNAAVTSPASSAHGDATARSGQLNAGDNPASAQPEMQPSPPYKERRRSPRYHCSGSVEFQAQGSEVRVWGTLTDISLHGCYVEMSATYPVETAARLVLEVLGIQVRVLGSVRVSYPFLGMGIGFTEIEPAQQLQLERLISALAGTSSFASRSPGRDSDLREALKTADPKALINEICRYFIASTSLSREDFLMLARRSGRS